jgi:hypothetical protein
VEVDLDLEDGLAVKETQRQDPFCCVINSWGRRAFGRGSDHLGNAAGLEAN